GAEVGRSPEVTVPITLQPEVTGSPSLLNNYLSYWVTIVARLKPGVTRQRAQANLAVLFEHAWNESAAVAPVPQRNEIQRFRRNLRLEVQSAATGVVSEIREQFSFPLL